MAFNLGSGSGENEVMVDMNTTPLIDVMLVLLVMIIMTLPIQTHAVKLDVPKPTPPPLIPPTVVNLAIDFDGTITWNGNPVPDMLTLDAYFVQEAAKGDTQDDIHLAPNRLAKYDTVAKVLSDAQRLGVTKIGFVGNEQYIQ
jgi:biopolymer transport protein ExbD